MSVCVPVCVRPEYNLACYPREPPILYLRQGRSLAWSSPSSWLVSFRDLPLSTSLGHWNYKHTPCMGIYLFLNLGYGDWIYALMPAKQELHWLSFQSSPPKKQFLRRELGFIIFFNLEILWGCGFMIWGLAESKVRQDLTENCFWTLPNIIQLSQAFVSPQEL